MDELVFATEFTRVARWAADRPAVVDQGTGRRTSFAEHHDRVARLSDAMGSRLGMARDTVFAVLLGTRSAYVELWHAGLCGAGVITSITTRAGRDEVRHVLRDSGAEVVFLDAGHAELVDGLRADVPGLRLVVLVGDDGDGGDGGGDDGRTPVPHDLGYEELVAHGRPRLPDLPGETDVALLMYTGGTTGEPRGVVQEQRAVMLARLRAESVAQPTPAWSYLQTTPMYHIAALMPVVKVHLGGAAVHLLPGFDAGTVLEVVEREVIGAMAVVPTMVVQLLARPDFGPERLRSLRYVGYGTAPMPSGLLGRLLDVLPADCRVCQSYGATETCATVTMLSDEDHRSGDPDLLRSAGRPLPGVTVSIRDPEGVELPDGEAGEIWVRCGSVLREYRNRPVETAAVLAGGWYHTGDAGRVDARGYLWIVDRVKDMVVSGGENVYSIEVENALSTLPGVVRAAVIGVPHELWGEAVHAVVQVGDEGPPVTVEGVLAHARQHLSGYKVPKSVRLTREPLPVSAAGKILKRTLREQWTATRGA